MATASVRQLRADVELATAQRDAEAARADNAEAERDALRTELAAVRRAVAQFDDARRRLTAHEVARLDAMPPEERQAAIDTAARAWREALEEARHWNEAATDATERAKRAEALARGIAQNLATAYADAVFEARARERRLWEERRQVKARLLELLKALHPRGLAPDLDEWPAPVWGLLHLVHEHTQKALTQRDALRTLLRSIVGAWEEAPASRRHELEALLPSLAQALQAAREGRTADWWTHE